MKLLILFLLMMSSLANAFDPICSTPREFHKKEMANIFTGEIAKSNQLIVYSVNPPTPIDWSSPGKTFKSIVRNSFINEGYDIEDKDSEGNSVLRRETVKTHFIGHMFVQLSCKGYPTILTGMTSPGTEEITGLMFEGKSFQQILSPTKGYMKVILTEKVPALGNIGEIVNVSAGHARNYLVPNGLAMVADEGNKKLLAAQQKSLGKKIQAQKDAAN